MSGERPPCHGGDPGAAGIQVVGTRPAVPVARNRGQCLTLEFDGILSLGLIAPFDHQFVAQAGVGEVANGSPAILHAAGDEQFYGEPHLGCSAAARTDCEEFAYLAAHLVEARGEVGLSQTAQQPEGVEEVALARPVCSNDYLERGQVQRKILKRLESVELDTSYHGDPLAAGWRLLLYHNTFEMRVCAA